LHSVLRMLWPLCNMLCPFTPAFVPASKSRAAPHTFTFEMSENRSMRGIVSPCHSAFSVSSRWAATEIRVDTPGFTPRVSGQTRAPW
jgi:hypothetical protein